MKELRTLESIDPRLLERLEAKGYRLEHDGPGGIYYPVYINHSTGIRRVGNLLAPTKGGDMPKSILGALKGVFPREDIPRRLAELGGYQEPSHYRQVMGAFLWTIYETLLEEDFYGVGVKSEDTAEVCGPL